MAVPECSIDIHEIIVYSTPAKKVNQERKKERHRLYPMDIQSYTTTNKDRHTIKQHKIGHVHISYACFWGTNVQKTLKEHSTNERTDYMKMNTKLKSASELHVVY